MVGNERADRRWLWPRRHGLEDDIGQLDPTQRRVGPRASADAAGVPAIEAMIAEGRSINITLIFSLARYAQVIEAYLSGLEAFVGKGGDPARVRSVASFFVSRVDTEVDGRLQAIGTDEALGLRGRAAVAQAKLA